MSRCRPLTPGELKRHPLPPIEEGDKYSHGTLLLIAGTREIAGAARISANSALRAGVGKIMPALLAKAQPSLE